MTQIEKIKAIQELLAVRPDGIFGPRSRAALEKLLEKPTYPEWSDDRWHTGKASSFADPADIRAYKRCKANGGRELECLAKGDNGIGVWGADTTAPIPMCALPREDWAHLPHPQGTLVIVEANGQTVRCRLEDTMPARANITNQAIVDLNPAAAQSLGLEPPFLVDARWRWA